MSNILALISTEKNPSLITVEVSTQNGNIFNILAVVTTALDQENQHEKSIELTAALFGGKAHSYKEALRLMEKYVNLV